MAENYSFFDAVLLDDGVTYDREYNAQQFTKYFGALVTTGVMKGMSNMLAVSANGSNMVTKIDTGIAFVEAKYYENDDFKELTHDTETLGKDRIDRIVIRMDLSTEARYVKAFIKKGVPSTIPVAPALTQTPNLYEISLAQVKIVGGQTFIATNAVTDERGKDVICPWAGSNILPNYDDNTLAIHMEDNTRHKNASRTVETGNFANAEGELTSAIGNHSHAEGVSTIAEGAISHAEGWKGHAKGNYSHAEGANGQALGEASHVEGYSSVAQGHNSHAEGYACKSLGSGSHAQGQSTEAQGHYSHSSGAYSKAIGESSTASGLFVTSNVMTSMALGRYNKPMNGSPALAVNTDDAFVIGNGIHTSSLGNAFRVRFNGTTYGVGAFNSTGADYAEYFEWLDGNVDKEDRVGFVVTLDGDKIRKATSNDEYILGIVSANPSIIGDSYQDEWNSKYILDEWGRQKYGWLTTKIEGEPDVYKAEDADTTREVYAPLLNPDWSAEEVYIPREDRIEWSAIGLMGKLYVRDDGTCVFNKYAKVGENNGVLTSSNEPTNIRVIERTSNNIVRVFMK